MNTDLVGILQEETEVTEGEEILIRRRKGGRFLTADRHGFGKVLYANCANFREFDFAIGHSRNSRNSRKVFIRVPCPSVVAC